MMSPVLARASVALAISQARSNTQSEAELFKGTSAITERW